jgi:hypothetical protein
VPAGGVEVEVEVGDVSGASDEVHELLPARVQPQQEMVAATVGELERAGMPPTTIVRR